MFELNDYIICGGNGVCKVIDIGVPGISTGNAKREYYKLQPIYESSSTVYIPVDNDKIVMRKIISKDEANEIINSIQSIDVLNFEDERMCDEVYKGVMHKYDCREWIKIIKTSYTRKKERIDDGKKTTVTDNKYLKLAEEYLFGELTISLDMTKENVEDMIVKQIKKYA